MQWLFHRQQKQIRQIFYQETRSALVVVIMHIVNSQRSRRVYHVKARKNDHLNDMLLLAAHHRLKVWRLIQELDMDLILKDDP